jgi:hypothetical protein
MRYPDHKNSIHKIITQTVPFAALHGSRMPYICTYITFITQYETRDSNDGR